MLGVGTQLDLTMTIPCDVCYNTGVEQSFELHLKGQRVCEQAERGFRGENSLGGDSMDKTLKYASFSRAWVQASERVELTAKNMKLERLARVCSEPSSG